MENSRVLKFRAWDIEFVEMCYPELITWGSDGKVIDLEGTRKSGGAAVLEEGEFILMQYTGLKDKNGKDPCAKDIVTLHLLQGRKISTIEIHDQWEIPVVNFFYYPEPLYLYAGKNKNDTCIEIIGNIYENPELLEKP